MRIETSSCCSVEGIVPISTVAEPRLSVTEPVRKRPKIGCGQSQHDAPDDLNFEDFDNDEDFMLSMSLPEVVP